MNPDAALKLVLDLARFFPRLAIVRALLVVATA